MSNLATTNSLGGQVRQLKDAPLVSIGGKLPLKLDINTSRLLDLMTYFLGDQIKAKDKRKQINNWLYTRARPGFYVEFDARGFPFHLAYADQRGGHGTQHYWRLFFDERMREKIELLVQAQATTANGTPYTDQTHTAEPSPDRGTREWGGMYFRSTAEMAIAQELNHAGVLFFANVRGRLDLTQSPITQGQHNGRVELDFLVFRGGKVCSLEVDGSQHSGSGHAIRDYARDRIMLREGIPTARFTAQECLQYPAQVVQEFLALFSPVPVQVPIQQPPIDVPLEHHAA